MSRLLALIDEYKDAHGQPSDSSIARAIGISPQALSSWRKRGIYALPKDETLRRLAGLIGRSHKSVVDAALVDAGWLDAEEVDGNGNATPIDASQHHRRHQ